MRPLARAGDIEWLRTYGLWARRLRSDMRAAETHRASRARRFQCGSRIRRRREPALDACGNRYRLERRPLPGTRPGGQRRAARAQRLRRLHPRRAAPARGRRQRGRRPAASPETMPLDGRPDDDACQPAARALLRLESPAAEAGRPSGKSRIDPHLDSRVAIRSPAGRSRSGAGRRRTGDTCSRSSMPPGAGLRPGRLRRATHRSPTLPTSRRRRASTSTGSRTAGRSTRADRQGRAGVRDPVLSHEIRASRQPAGTEAETECYGMQALERVARGLGAPASYARELAGRTSGNTTIRATTPSTTRSSARTAGRSTRTPRRRVPSWP